MAMIAATTKSIERRTVATTGCWQRSGCGAARVFQSVARKADHEEPWRTGDGRRGEHDKQTSDPDSTAMTFHRPSATAKPM